MSAATENDGFLGGSKSAKAAERDRTSGGGCLTSKGCTICAVVTGVIGILFVLLGLLAVFAGEGFLETAILNSMALTEGSDRTESWLRPPVTPYLSGYAFHIKNPDAVLRGKKPILEERGPYVYKSVTVKDADDNMVWGDDGTLTYRARKIYTFMPEMSGPGLDPYKDVITVPNIPLWTGLHGLRDKGQGMAMDIGRQLVTENGRGTAFVSVTFDGLLWGYEDELPCLKLDKPSECGGDSFADDGGWGDDDDSWGDDDWKRKKRSADDDEWKNPDLNPDSEYYGLAKPTAEFVDCKCQWGLFRDRNVTMRKPIQFLTGVTDLAKKGIVVEYDGKKELGWWKKGSACDTVGGQDSSTLPPGLNKESKPNIFIDLLCRGLPFEFEKETEHAGIKSLRFIPPPNAMGSHNDPNPEFRNEDNECYCLEDENFQCFGSGVLNMEPCKRDVKAPLALSFPHFYQADPKYRDAVIGMDPKKEKHEFYIDVMPEFGFPVSMRPRFQLNVVIGRRVDPGWSAIASMQDQIVLPFLWAQDGFGEPSEQMAEDLKFGLAAPKKLPLAGGVVFFAIGGALVLASLAFGAWRKRRSSTGAANLTNGDCTVVT